ncbi:MAG: metal ABC transporter permease [Synechococcales cyanobacterium CRU_2_2]|nr:metal ABC transporter permease [Synechococcales cyanobacterium CRU_2_2]
MEIDWQNLINLIQMPFMQRAILGGLLLGTLGGLVGSFTVLRQLSFFGDALGHSALLGTSLGLLFGIGPHLTMVPFLVFLGLCITYLLEKTHLWRDALLNVVYSSSLALAIIILSFINQYKGGLNQFLFGDVLAIQTDDLYFNLVLLLMCSTFLGLTLRTQMLITLNEPLAKVKGVSVSLYRTAFVVFLSLVVAVAIQSVGVLLVSAFLVMPACTARLLSHRFGQYVMLSIALGSICATIGVICSAGFDLPSGPTIVMIQFFVFLGAMLVSNLHLAPG